MAYGLKTLKEIDFKFEPFEEYEMRFEANNNILKGFIKKKKYHQDWNHYRIFIIIFSPKLNRQCIA
jgi:hypothetical protein